MFPRSNEDMDPGDTAKKGGAAKRTRHAPGVPGGAGSNFTAQRLAKRNRPKSGEYLVAPAKMTFRPVRAPFKAPVRFLHVALASGAELQ